MEILMVIAIIGIIASVVMPAVNRAREKGQVAKAQIELSQVQTAMTTLYDDVGLYPNGASDFCRDTLPADNEINLASTDAGLTGNTAGWADWNGPYIAEATDPWGTPYYLDEDYQCLASTTGCKGIADAGNDSSVIVSCGPNAATDTYSCIYDSDNIVLKLCE